MQLLYWSQGNIVESFEHFCIRQAAGGTGNGLRSHYYSVLKIGHTIKSDGTSTLSWARHRASQRRPKITPISMLELPNHRRSAQHNSATKGSHSLPIQNSSAPLSPNYKEGSKHSHEAQQASHRRQMQKGHREAQEQGHETSFQQPTKQTQM